MKINKQIILKIKEESQKYFLGTDGCHDWGHVERVYNLALKIGKEEKADLNIIKIAVYLHDVGRKEETTSRGRICHAEKGVELAKEILRPYDLTNEVIENILHCILSHRNRNSHKPHTIEAKVLFDADKLDGTGAVGVARDFLFAGHLGSRLYTGNEKKIAKSDRDYGYTEEDSALLEYYISLSKIKSKVLTNSGKKIAKERHEFMEEFFKRFELEIKGIL